MERLYLQIKQPKLVFSVYMKYGIISGGIRVDHKFFNSYFGCGIFLYTIHVTKHRNCKVPLKGNEVSISSQLQYKDDFVFFCFQTQQLLSPVNIN